MNYKKTCKLCGKQYISGSHNSLYCPECQKIVKREASKKAKRNAREIAGVHCIGNEMVCPICGKRFIIEKHGQKYCCDECANVAKNARSKRTKKSVGVKKEHICEICGKVYLSNKPMQKYCSIECARLAKNAEKKKIYAEKHSGECTCIICGNHFMGRAGQKYCSLKCQRRGWYLSKKNKLSDDPVMRERERRWVAKSKMRNDIKNQLVNIKKLGNIDYRILQVSSVVNWANTNMTDLENKWEERHGSNYGENAV
jgi:uncharacterized Zn ribbon protein